MAWIPCSRYEVLVNGSVYQRTRLDLATSVMNMLEATERLQNAQCLFYKNIQLPLGPVSPLCLIRGSSFTN